MHIYKRVLIVLYTLFSITAFAKEPRNNTLKGVVTDVSGQPLFGAVISIPDLKAGAATDTNGYYEVNNLPKGNYLVQVHMLSYSTITTTIFINGTTTKNFKLSESLIEKSEVVVTGTSLATEQRKSTTPITSVSIKELQENASTNIIDAIAKLPGVNQVTTGPAISKPVIRGLSSNRILTINDGVRQEGQQWGDEHGIEIDDYNVSKIEVLKGPASLAYGSDALAGVVNIISDEPIQEGKKQGNVSLNYQTNNGLFAGNANVEGNTNGFSWKAYATGKIAHDYQEKYDGPVYNSRYNNANFGGSIGLNKQWGYSRLSFTSFNQTLGISEGNRDSATGDFIKTVNNNGAAEEQLMTNQDGKSYITAIPRQRIVHQKLTWNNNLYLNNGARIGLTLGYQQNTREEFGDVLNPNESGLHLVLRTFTYDLKYYLKQIKGWQVTSGIGGMNQNNKNKGIEFLIPDYSLFDIGAYAVARKDIGKWSVSGGLRYDYRTITTSSLFTDSLGVKTANLETGGLTRFNAFTRNYSVVTGSVGASYTLNDKTTLKVNGASGFRAPNIAEISANGVHEGTIRYEYGNNNLKPENSLQGDIGGEYKSEHIYVNTALFGNFIHNYIYIRKLQGANSLDSIPTINNDAQVPAYIYDQRNALLYGGEFYLDIHPHPFDWLHFENTFSYVRGVFTGSTTDSTKNLPNIPQTRWQISLRAQKRSLNNWMKNGYIKVGADINFAQNNIFSAYQTETASPAYTLFNAGLGFDVTNHKQKTICSFTLSAQNILNTAYQDHLSRLRYADVNNVTGREGIWNMGRSFSLLLSFPLQF